jgi:hypothetical protein
VNISQTTLRIGAVLGTVGVLAEEASRLAHVASSALVAVGRRDLTRI